MGACRDSTSRLSGAGLRRPTALLWKRRSRPRDCRRLAVPPVADLVVLNTCTVTATADDEVRQTVRRIHREKPEARILVTGCYAQRAPEEWPALPGVWLVVGNSHKTRIPGSGRRQRPRITGRSRSAIFSRSGFSVGAGGGRAGDRTRPNLKIQDGCNNRCSFCIIPFVRGRSRSSPAEA